MPFDPNDLSQFSNDPLPAGTYVEPGDSTLVLPATGTVILQRIMDAGPDPYTWANILLKISDENAKQNGRTFFAFLSGKPMQRQHPKDGSSGYGSTLEDFFRACGEPLPNSKYEQAQTLTRILQLHSPAKARWDWSAYSTEEEQAALRVLVGLDGTNEEVKARATTEQRKLAQKAAAVANKYSDFPLAPKDENFESLYGVPKRLEYLMTPNGFEVRARIQVKVWIPKKAEVLKAEFEGSF